MEAMMRPSDDLLSTPELDFEAWRDALRPEWGRYTPEAIEPETFAGRVRARRICGFVAIDLSCNAHRVERTQRDARLDGVDHYYAVFQVAGRFSRRCGARTRSGSRCRSAAMPNGRCRMHGGMSPGAPKGNTNAFKHGHYTAEAIATRREIAKLLRDARALVKQVS